MAQATTGSANDQSNQSSATGSPTSSTPQDQSGAAAGTSSADQNAAGQAGQNATGNAADQSAAGTSNAQGGNLPQTGSELPLLALLGVGSLSAGVWKAYFKK
jgi:LPXTG-motif cell wall-anchored protein